MLFRSRDIPKLLATPAAVRFLSIEPMLGPIDLMTIRRPSPLGSMSALPCEPGGTYMDWIICGGESGPHARPMHPDWARGLRDQCVEAGVPFLFKQWGEWEPRRGFACPDDLPTEGWIHFDPECSMRKVGKKAAGRLLEGRTWDEVPG